MSPFDSVVMSRSIARSAPVRATTTSGSGLAIEVVGIDSSRSGWGVLPLTTSSALTSFAARKESAMGREYVVLNVRVSASNHVYSSSGISRTSGPKFVRL